MGPLATAPGSRSAGTQRHAEPDLALHRVAAQQPAAHQRRDQVDGRAVPQPGHPLELAALDFQAGQEQAVEGAQGLQLHPAPDGLLPEAQAGRDALLDGAQVEHRALERHLVDAGIQDIVDPVNLGRFAEVAPAVQVAAPWLVDSGQQGAIAIDRPGEAPQGRPQASGVPQVAERGGHVQPHHAAIAADEGVDPAQALCAAAMATKAASPRRTPS